MRHRVYVDRVVSLGGRTQRIAVLEFEAYDFDVIGSTIRAQSFGERAEGAERWTIDLQIPGYTTFVIHDDHDRVVWDGYQKVIDG